MDEKIETLYRRRARSLFLIRDEYTEERAKQICRRDIEIVDRELKALGATIPGDSLGAEGRDGGAAIDEDAGLPR